MKLWYKLSVSIFFLAGIFFVFTKSVFAVQGVTVVIKNFQFSPQQITVTPGTTVTWVNQETSTAHSSTSDDQSGSEIWDSQILQPGQSFSHTFTHDGTFAYHCSVHPMMMATIQVAANATPTPSPIATSQPTPSLNPNNTNFSLTVFLHGIFNGGDNPNPAHGGNKTPRHPQRTITVSVYGSDNTIVAVKKGTVLYNSAAGNFTGTIDMGDLVSDSYLIFLKTPGFLQKQLPGIQNITQKENNTLSPVYFVGGDINNDNKLDILDYNILVSCFESKQITASCKNSPTFSSPGADITDDGVIDGVDYNLFLRELSVQKGNEIPTVIPSP